MAIHSENAILAAFNSADDLQIPSEPLQRAVDSLQAWDDVDLVSNLAIISLVGRQLQGMRGISGHFFRTLGENGINVDRRAAHQIWGPPGRKAVEQLELKIAGV
jgi:aspartokinase